MKWNLDNFWRVVLAILGIGIFLDMVNWKMLGEYLMTVGGVGVICMVAADFERVKQKWFDLG